MTIHSLEASEIFDHVYLLKMPLPFRLDHINLYLLEDSDGWILVDTGLNTDLSRQLWGNFLSSSFFEKPIKSIVLTHLHPDHIGMSAWLCETLSVPVFISSGDWAMARFLWNNDTDFAKEKYEQYWSNFGIPSDKLEEMVELRNHYKKLVKALPTRVSIINPKDTLKVMSGIWEFLPGSGHSPEHMCLWNASSNLLISGDHILPTITPNISIHPTGLTNPLESYLQSLESFRNLACEHYLPAHGPVSDNYQHRVDEILLHHQHKFAQIMNGLPEFSTVFNAMPLLFNRDLPAHQLMFAYCETAAHLVCLAERGLLQRDSNDPWLFINPFSQAACLSNLDSKKVVGQPNPC